MKSVTESRSIVTASTAQIAHSWPTVKIPTPIARGSRNSHIQRKVATDDTLPFPRPFRTALREAYEASNISVRSRNPRVLATRV